MARKLKKSRVTLLVLAVILVIALIGGALFVNGQKQAVNLENEVSVVIDKGSSATAIAKKLEDNGVIKSWRAFNSYIKSNDLGAVLKPGEYVFGPGETSFSQIAEILKKGKLKASKNITVPEGYTVMQIAELMEKKGVTTKEKFLDYCANGDFPYDYIPAKGDSTRLEGFLFPETYNIEEDWGEKEVVNMMLKQFDKTFTSEWREQAKKMNMSIYDITTLASIIEREARVEKDRPLMAGVFYNRLEKGMLLQSCATVQYALGEVKPVLSYEDIAIESPYNTYKYKGLTPTPISVPGKAALEAALYPAETDYLYFLAKPDGSHAFSKTYDEHLKNKDKYLP